MNGAFGGDRNAGEPAKQTLADLTSAPTGVLALHVQDVVLHLKGKLISVAIGTAAAIGESLHAALLIAIEYLVAGFAGDAKLPTEFRHWLAGEPASHKLQSFIHYRTLLPRHSLLPKKGKSVTYVSGTICYLCLGSLKGLNWSCALFALRLEPDALFCCPLVPSHQLPHRRKCSMWF